MFAVALNKPDIDKAHRVSVDAYALAKSWIGRFLILRKPHLAFGPGTRCKVMCVVDFGEGPLLWIVSDDKLSIEIDQLPVSLIQDYFQIMNPEAMHRSG